MLSYLQGSTRLDISMAVHQCARFSNQPKLSHEKAVKRIVKYLSITCERGIIYKPNKSKGIECYADADFAGSWNAEDAADANNVLSRSGYVILYAGCPVLWASKLQTEIALSTAEAEYIALSQALREVIPFMNLMGEMKPIFNLKLPSPQIVGKVYEDNQSCIAMARNQKCPWCPYRDVARNECSSRAAARRLSD